MQKKLLALCLTLCSQPLLFSMDKKTDNEFELKDINPSSKQPTADLTKTIALDEMINTIDKAINKKYSVDNSVLNFLGTFQLIEKNMFDIIQTIEQCYGTTFTPNNDLINKLCAKNNFFSTAIDYFSNLARKNFDNATCSSLNTVVDHTLQQPTPQLNQLPLSIRKYVIKRAFKEINHEYDMILGGHTESIHSFDICQATHQAATCSINARGQKSEHDNNTFYLWDLKTGNIIHTFDEKKPINLLAFSPDGSYIAAALYGANVIKVWLPHTKALQHTFPTNGIAQSMQYTHPENHTLMVIERDAYGYEILTQCTLATHNPTAGISVSSNYIDARKRMDNFKEGTKYRAIHPANNIIASQYMLFVTKQNCYALYLCEQAIKNTNSEQSLKNINSTNSYLNLTTYEQKIVHDLAQEKIVILQRNQPKQQITSLNKLKSRQIL